MDKANKASLECYIVLMYDLMQKMRSDLTLLKDPENKKPILDTAADQLLEIATNSMNSSESIVKANGNIADITESLLKQAEYDDARKQFESILGSCVNVRVASNRHESDCKGILSVIETIKQVEGILNSLVVRVGDSQVAGIDTALSGINMTKAENTNERIPMGSYKKPKTPKLADAKE